MKINKKSNINLTSNSQNQKKKYLTFQNLRISITDILAPSNKREQPAKLKQLTLV